MKYLILFFYFGLLFSCKGERNSEQKNKNPLVIEDNIEIKKDSIVMDSVDLIAKKFIWFDEHSKPEGYQIEEPDLHDFYTSNESLSRKYFPLILDKYDIPLNKKIILYCYLYELGEKQYLEGLCEEELTDLEKLSFNQNISNHKIQTPCK